MKLVAVAVVAQAVLGTARTLPPDLRRVGIAVAAAGIVALVAASVGQVAAS
nr:hypothetical protein [Caulobacter sp. CCUG 60055]